MPHNAYHIKNLIMQISDAYYIFSETGTGNTDYADYACQALQDFQKLLGCPHMTHKELSMLLRQGSYAHKYGAPGTCWASFLADYMSEAANSNHTSH